VLFALLAVRVLRLGSMHLHKKKDDEKTEVLKKSTISWEKTVFSNLPLLPAY